MLRDLSWALSAGFRIECNCREAIAESFLWRLSSCLSTLLYIDKAKNGSSFQHGIIVCQVSHQIRDMCTDSIFISLPAGADRAKRELGDQKAAHQGFDGRWGGCCCEIRATHTLWSLPPDLWVWWGPEWRYLPFWHPLWDSAMGQPSAGWTCAGKLAPGW